MAMSRLVGLALAPVLWSAAALAEPSGRVVRVERSGLARVTPRVCEIHADSGTCLGEEPRSGQTVIVLDENHATAELQIVEAAAFSPSCPTLWTVKTRAVHLSNGESEGMGLIDPRLDAGRARMLTRDRLPASPSGSADDEVWRAFDRDGDGVADVVITRFGCDPAGRPAAGAMYCIDVWARTGTRMARATQLNFATCNR